MNLDSLQYAHRFDGVTGSAIREIFKIIARPGMVSFAGGNPAKDALPDEVVSEMCEYVMKNDGKAILQYGATEGYAPFLESLKKYIQEKFAKDIPAVLPVTGSTQAMDLLCKALVDPGDVVLVEDPSFLGNLQCIRLYQANIVPIPSDDQGLLTDQLETAMATLHPKMLYTIPTFQNPTGRTMPVERRKKVAELAAKYGVVVAEDDPYHDLRYRGTELPTIKSFDQEGWVVFLGSFSKVISPGMRVGFMAGDAGIIRKCTIGKQSSDLHTANLTQAVVDQFLRRDLLPAHIERINVSYRTQMLAMLEELKKFPAGTRFTEPDGGLFIWVELPEKLNAREILDQAIARNVAFVPGTHFYINGGHENTLRLNFSNSTVQQIHDNMPTIREIVENSL